MLGGDGQYLQTLLPQPMPHACVFTWPSVMLPLIPANLEPHCLTLDLGSWDGFGLGMCFTSSISPEVTEGSPSDANCLLQQNEDFPRAVLLPSDWGVPHAWIVCLPALRLGLGVPQTAVVLSSPDHRPPQWGALHQAGDTQSCAPLLLSCF